MNSRYDDRDKPVLAVVLNLLGWLAIFAAVALALIRSGYYKPPLPAPPVAWIEVARHAPPPSLA
jgi:hypothetical protein